MGTALDYLYIGLMVGSVLVAVRGGILLVGYIASGERDRLALRNALFLIAAGVMLVLGAIFGASLGAS